LFFKYASYHHFATSFDGITWSATQVVSNLGGSAGDYPDFAVINGQLFAFRLGYTNVNVKQFNGYTFIDIPTSSIPGADFSDSKGAVFAELNGTYYIFSANSASVSKVQSTDGINWTNFERICSFCAPIGSTTVDALSFNGLVFISFKAPDPDNRIGVIKYNGLFAFSQMITDSHGVILKTRSINVPMATDGTKLLISYRGNGANDKNYVVYSTSGGSPWIVQDSGGTSYWNGYRDIIYASGN
jgi:hypothetical protein